MSIHRYVLVDLTDQEGDVEYDNVQEAIDAADEYHAIIERRYDYADSELVWTPDEGMNCSTWPPKKKRTKERANG